MIDHIWTVVCGTVAIDKETNNVSLQNILEQLTIQEVGIPEGVDFDEIETQKIMIPHKFSVISFWTRSNLKQKVRGFGRVKLYSSKEELLFTSPEYEIDLLSNRRFRSTGKFDGFPVKGSGKYEFKVDMKINEESTWKNVASIPVEVKIPDKKKWKKMKFK